MLKRLEKSQKPSSPIQDYVSNANTSEQFAATGTRGGSSLQTEIKVKQYQRDIDGRDKKIKGSGTEKGH